MKAMLLHGAEMECDKWASAKIKLIAIELSQLHQLHSYIIIIIPLWMHPVEISPVKSGRHEDEVKRIKFEESFPVFKDDKHKGSFSPSA